MAGVKTDCLGVIRWFGDFTSAGTFSSEKKTNSQIPVMRHPSEGGQVSGAASTSERCPAARNCCRPRYGWRLLGRSVSRSHEHLRVVPGARTGKAFRPDCPSGGLFGLDDIVPVAFEQRNEFRVLTAGHSVFSQCLSCQFEVRLPFRPGDVQSGMGIPHTSSGVIAWPASQSANHFHRQLLRSFAGIRAAAHAKPAESRISTHESKPIIDYFRYNVVSADSLIQRRFRCLLRDFHTVIMLLSE